MWSEIKTESRIQEARQGGEKQRDPGGKSRRKLRSQEVQWVKIMVPKTQTTENSLSQEICSPKKAVLPTYCNKQKLAVDRGYPRTSILTVSKYRGGKRKPSPCRCALMLAGPWTVQLGFQGESQGGRVPELGILSKRHPSETRRLSPPILQSLPCLQGPSVPRIKHIFLRHQQTATSPRQQHSG